MIVLATNGYAYCFYLNGVKISEIEPNTFDLVMVALGVGYERIDLDDFPDEL
jgi:hypothetical protein